MVRPRSVRILVAPQEFKGSLEASEAAQAICQGVRAVRPKAQLEVAPLADGGPGTVEAYLQGLGGQRREATVADPLGRPVRARYGMLADGTAVVEMAAASGLWRLEPGERDPLRAHTLGTGELVRAALEAGASKVVVGAGGSATCDGGVGAAMALGVRFLDEGGAALGPAPLQMERLARIDLAGLHPSLTAVSLQVITDVRNPLCGEEGTALVYGPQKGADPATCLRLDGLLWHLAQVARDQLGREDHQWPGAGAGGGLAYGLSALCGAKLRSGFEAVCAALGLGERILRAQVVLTGEGQLDAQTAYEKGPYALARLARGAGRQVVMFAGRVAASASRAKEAFDEVVEVTPPGLSMEELRAGAFTRLQEAATRWAQRALASGE